MHDYDPDLEIDEPATEFDDTAIDIDAELAKRRPDRYEDDEWLDPVIALRAKELREHSTVDDLARYKAAAQVRRREGENVKELNRLVEKVADDQTLPLWDDLDKVREMFTQWHHLPLDRGDIRVRFGSAEAVDFEAYAEFTSARRTERNIREKKEEDGARFLARWMVARDVTTLESL